MDGFYRLVPLEGEVCFFQRALESCQTTGVVPCCNRSGNGVDRIGAFDCDTVNCHAPVEHGVEHRAAAQITGEVESAPGNTPPAHPWYRLLALGRQGVPR